MPSKRWFGRPERVIESGAARAAWAVDPATNQVVISAGQSVQGSRLTKLKSVAGELGSAARIERLNGKLGTFAGPTMLDGSAIFTSNVRCSLGYNVFDGFGRHYVRGGHVTAVGTTVAYSNG